MLLTTVQLQCINIFLQVMYWSILSSLSQFLFGHFPWNTKSEFMTKQSSVFRNYALQQIYSILLQKTWFSVLYTTRITPASYVKTLSQLCHSSEPLLSTYMWVFKKKKKKPQAPCTAKTNKHEGRVTSLGQNTLSMRVMAGLLRIEYKT